MTEPHDTPPPAALGKAQLDGRQVTVENRASVAATLWTAQIYACRTSTAGEARGPLCGMGICFECRVTIDGVPHQRACMVSAVDKDVRTTAPGAPPGRRDAAPAPVIPSPPPPADAPATAPGDPAAPSIEEMAAPTTGLAAGVVVAGVGPAGIVAARNAAAPATVPVDPAAPSMEVIAAGVAVAGVGPAGIVAARAAAAPGSAPGAPVTPSTADVAMAAALTEMAADVVVVGAGPAGIAAACAAAESGAKVLVIDAGAAAGGQIWRPWRGWQSPPAGPNSEAARSVQRHGWMSLLRNPGLARGVRARLAWRLLLEERDAASAWRARLAASGALVLAETTVVDARPGLLHAECGGRGLRIAAGRIVIATGAREMWLPFPGWTLPNVVGVGGLQALVKQGAPVRDRRIVIAGSGPLLLPVAATVVRAGARLVTVAEQAAFGAVAAFAAGLLGSPGRLAQAARYRAAFPFCRYRTGTWVAAAHGETGGTGSAHGATADGGAVREVTLTNGRRSWRERCDVLACAHGLIPNLGLARLLGCAIEGEAGGAAAAGARVAVDGRQQTSVPGIYCAGEAAGVGGLDLALASGEIAGLAAAGAGADLDAPAARALAHRRDRAKRIVPRLARSFAPRPELARMATPETIVCRCEDVRLARLDPAWSPRQAKIYTRAGMGACQGRVCGPAVAVFCRGKDAAGDSARPPLEPVSLSLLASLGTRSGSRSGTSGGGAVTPPAAAAHSSHSPTSGD